MMSALASLEDFPFAPVASECTVEYVLRWTCEAMPDGFPSATGSAVKDLDVRVAQMGPLFVEIVGLRTKPGNISILVCERTFQNLDAALAYRRKLIAREVPEGGLIESEIRRVVR